jgi:antitoxin (DNA-binding transcriptional repressor) of toxin-antitoxin stability system
MKTIDDNTVSLKELREQFPRYIAAIKSGKSFTVIKRSQPIFKITPVTDDGEWVTIADFTKANLNGVEADEILKHL